jgi:hypothetical protein
MHVSSLLIYPCDSVSQPNLAASDDPRGDPATAAHGVVAAGAEVYS